MNVNELVERLRQLMRFASDQKSRDWDEQDEIRNVFHSAFKTLQDAKAALEALSRAPEPILQCTGCGSTKPIEHYRSIGALSCCPERDMQPVAQGVAEPVVLPPIVSDGPREYIPLPGGWEVQTKGTGSSYRLLDKKSDERHAILCNEAPFVQDFFTRCAKEVRAAYLSSTAALSALRAGDTLPGGLVVSDPQAEKRRAINARRMVEEAQRKVAAIRAALPE